MEFIYSQNSYFLKKEISDKKRDFNNRNKNNCEIISFSLIDDNFDEIVNTILNNSFFSPKRLIVINDCYFATDKKIKLNNRFNFKVIEDISSINSKDLELIFTVNYKELSKRSKLNTFYKNVKLVKINSKSDREIFEYICLFLDKNNIKYEKEFIWYIMSKHNNDLELIFREIKKYKNLHNYFNLENMKGDTLDSNKKYDIWVLLDSFINNNIDIFTSQIEMYFNYSKDYFGLLNTLINNLVLLRNIIILKYNKSLTVVEIENMLGLNPYRLRKILDYRERSLSKINKKIKKLCILTYNVIDGKFNKNEIFILYLLNLIR